MKEKLITIEIPSGYAVRNISEGKITLAYLYPRTFSECVEELGLQPTEEPSAEGYVDSEALELLQLIVCRDAWLKQYNKWKPNWKNAKEAKYVINVERGVLARSVKFIESCPMAFPTQEMRDCFLECFGYKLERCKELL